MEKAAIRGLIVPSIMVWFQAYTFPLKLLLHDIAVDDDFCPLYIRLLKETSLPVCVHYIIPGIVFELLMPSFAVCGKLVTAKTISALIVSFKISYVHQTWMPLLLCTLCPFGKCRPITYIDVWPRSADALIGFGGRSFNKKNEIPIIQ